MKPKVTNFRLENKSLLSAFSPEMTEVRVAEKLRHNNVHRMFVEQRAKKQTEQKREFFQGYLCKQDNLRETKIRLAKLFIDRTKNMKRMRSFVT